MWANVFGVTLSHNAIHWVFLAMLTLETDKMYCFPFQLAIYSPVTAFLLLISSALVLDVAVRFRRSEEITDNRIHQLCDLVPCGNIEAAGVSLVL